jgi:hypothetical protein
MTYADLNKDQVNQVANYYAAAEATKRGFKVSLIGDETPERRYRLTINGHVAGVFGRRTDWPMRMATKQDLPDDAEFAIFVHLSDVPKFYVVPASESRGTVEDWADKWDQLK